MTILTEQCSEIRTTVSHRQESFQNKEDVPVVLWFFLRIICAYICRRILYTTM